jgi:ABC-type sugar transport system ATPase subunit
VVTQIEKGLEAIGITKVFGDLSALERVSLAVEPGEVHGLVGHNGAGKSTLLRVFAGAIRPEKGRLRMSGRDVSFNGPADAIAAGISSVYQELSLLPNLTIAENTFLGAELTRVGVLRRHAMEEETRQLLERFKLNLDPLMKLAELSVAQRQLVEIAVAVHRNARFLLLDEPTASLEAGQVDRLLEWLRDLAQRENVGVLLIGHKVNEVLAVSDRITALIDGRVAISGSVREITRDDLIAAITGKQTVQRVSRVAEPAARIVNLRKENPGLIIRGLQTVQLSRIDLTARPKRVLGLYGLVGSGRSAFLRSLIGVEPLIDGSITLFGRPYWPKSPRDAARHGVVLVTEDRKTDGFIPQLDARLNVALPVLKDFVKFEWLRRSYMRRDASVALQQVAVKGDLDGPMARLSGGNQQKVLFARAIRQKPKLLLLDEPTKGVDIGAKGEIHQIIRRLAEENDEVLVIVVSSEEEEILAISDDIVIFRAGSSDGYAYNPATLKLRDGSLRSLAWHQEEVENQFPVRKVPPKPT